jgi:hypothetical protein
MIDMKISAWLKWYIYSIKYRKPHVYLTDDAIYIFDKKICSIPDASPRFQRKVYFILIME